MNDERKTVPGMLREAAGTYEERNAMYGDNYKLFGAVFKAMFPEEKLEVSSPKDFNRLGILVQIVAKITRYAASFDRGGHDDSLLDIAVYSQMLRELDRERIEAEGNSISFIVNPINTEVENG